MRHEHIYEFNRVQFAGNEVVYKCRCGKEEIYNKDKDQWY